MNFHLYIDINVYMWLCEKSFQFAIKKNMYEIVLIYKNGVFTLQWYHLRHIQVLGSIEFF